MQGRGVDPPLNETGMKQALQFYNYYRNEGFEIIYTSCLRRSYETVEPFIKDGIPWEKHAELDEVSWGIWEGKPVTTEFKALYKKLQDDWKVGHLDEKIKEGESPLEVSERQKQFIQYLLTKPERKNHICMHGRAMRMFLANLLNHDLRTMDNYPHHNLTLYKVIFDGDHFSITLFNNMDHLYADGKN